MSDVLGRRKLCSDRYWLLAVNGVHTSVDAAPGAAARKGACGVWSTAAYRACWLPIPRHSRSADGIWRRHATWHSAAAPTLMHPPQVLPQPVQGVGQRLLGKAGAATAAHRPRVWAHVSAHAAGRTGRCGPHPHTHIGARRWHCPVAWRNLPLCETWIFLPCTPPWCRHFSWDADIGGIRYIQWPLG